MNQPLTILTVVGARPQFVKAAVVSRVLKEAGVRELLLHTGQHYDANMSDVFFEELEIPPPDFHLGVGSGRHGEQTGRMLAGIEGVLLDVQPDWVLVYGDTNSTLAGALAAVKLHIPVAHVEAGLRSYNRRMPEEINRIVTDEVAQLLLAPTATAVENLRSEGISGERVELVGDVMFDATLHFREVAVQKSTVLNRLNLAENDYVLVTAHRAENVDDPQRLAALVKGISSLAEDSHVVFPVHPRTRHALHNAGLLAAGPEKLQLIDPVGYLDSLMLLRHARLLVTDSGGMQKEAYFLRVPCLTLRDETEWPETVQLGWNQLVEHEDFPHLSRLVSTWLNDAARMEPTSDPFGGGSAAERIAECLLSLNASKGAVG